ncbi:sce7726 family protein [Jeotgalibacillus soli]|uniref:sce7726 family protein n=1 Tax=Jeotgalibacillus soli TaxID=889306 RepID=UPI000596DE10|nr:sce7726 family protein [Jeotgalibacillus soli]
MRKLKDHDIREVLLEHLNIKYANDHNTRIVNEMGVIHGQSRVDIAVINGVLHGYEIKSESDNLLRLPSQILDYNKVFDRMTIVVQRKHFEGVREMIPKWWGIILVSKIKDEISLREVRKGKVNNNIDPFILSQLLWRDEALNVLKERGLQKGYLSKPRNVIYKRLSDSLSVNEIKITVNQQLKQRVGWRDHKPPMLDDGLLQH